MQAFPPVSQSENIASPTIFASDYEIYAMEVKRDAG